MILICLFLIFLAVSKEEKDEKDERNLYLTEKECEELSHQFLNPVRCKNTELRKGIDKFVADFKTKNKDTNFAPVILIPGLTGSGLDGYLHEKTSPAWYCFKSWRTWFSMWISFYELFTSTCLLDNISMDFDNVTRKFSNRNGVDTRPRDFGGLGGVDYVDVTDDVFGVTKVFADITYAFKSIGYQEGVNLFGAPFDWRLPLFALETGSSFGDALFALINKATQISQQKVTIVTHSYGGLVFLNFMNHYLPPHMTRAQFDVWLQQSINSFVPVAGPWSGTAKTIRGVLSGDSFGVPGYFVDSAQVATLTRTLGGAIQLFPDPLFWPKNWTFVSTPSQNYSGTFHDLQLLLSKVGATSTLEIFKQTHLAIDNLRMPLITTYCLYGFDRRTPISFNYGNGLSTSINPPPQPTHIDDSDMGDGVVPLASLLECQAWDVIDPIHKNHIRCREYDLDGHDDLQDLKMISDIVSIATGDKNTIATCETKNLDAQMAQLGSRRPEKADQIERLRNTMKV